MSDVTIGTRAGEGRWVGVASRVLLLALCAAGLAFAYFWMFRQFQGYDDEGYLLVAVQHLVDGHRMYDDVVMVYGPGYFLYRWVLHGLFGWTVSNDVVRTITVVTWIVCVFAYGAIAYRIAKRTGHALALAVVVAAFALYQLRVLTHEAGHPQELATLLVAAAMWSAGLAFAARYRTLAICAGLAAGAVAMTKLNLGAFFAASSFLALVIDAPRRTAWGLGAQLVAIGGALALPYALLHTRFADETAVNLCVVVTASLVACLPHALHTRVDARFRFASLAGYVLGFAAAIAAALAFIVARGSSLGAVYECLVVSARKFATDFIFPMRCDWKAVVFAGALLAASFAAWIAPRRLAGARGGWVLALMKLGAGAFLFFCAVRDPELLVKYGGACAWLALVDPDRRLSTEELFLRRFVCLVAVLQVLQVFPVPGSQVSIGSAPLLLVAIACIADGLEHFSFAGLVPRSAAIAPAAAVLMGAGSVAWIAVQAVQVGKAYENRTSPELRGCRLTRLPEWQAVVYRWLADNLDASCDAFLSVQGQNSLYSWTGRKPASSVIVSTAWNLFDDAQQQDLVDSHAKFEKLMVVDNPEVFGPAKRAGIPFFRYVDRELSPLARVAQNTLLVRKERGPVALVGCAWWLERDVDAVPAALAQYFARDSVASVLALQVPEGRIARDVERIDLVDVMRGKTVLASTSHAEADSKRRMQLADSEGKPVLVDQPGAFAPAEGARPNGVSVLVPRGAVPERTELLALRFYARDGERLLTLPVAQRARRR